ncbi:MAG: hypothetical protein GX171_05635, partial [Clostridiales bacterium]|nr:hypothetical protein [Clostridiales bacterium]
MFKKTLSLLLCLALLSGFGTMLAEVPAGVSGTFTGESEGFSSEALIKVSVTLADGKITEVKVDEHAESVDVIPAVVTALEEIPAKMVESNSVDVEAVAGAS